MKRLAAEMVPRGKADKNKEAPRKGGLQMMQMYQNRYCVVVAGGVAGAGGASAAGGVGASAAGGVAGAGASGSDVAGAELSVTTGVVEVPLQSNERAKRMPSTTTRAAMIRPVELPDGRADWLT
jgi:hypothetical protein